MEYNESTIEVELSANFARWLEELRDVEARERINIRLRRVSLGNFGDSRYVGGKVSELRIDYGPGYRVYFVRRGRDSVGMILGGVKGTQRRDIEQAQAMATKIFQQE